MEDLRAAVVGANVAESKGALDGAQQSYTIAANDRISAAFAYRTVVVAYRNGAPVLLQDVADVIDGLENSRVGGWYQGEPAVIIDVQRQPGANIIGTVDLVKRELPRLSRSMAAGVNLKIVNDRTETIRASIADVEFTLVLAAGLVVLVVLLFLRTLRATIIAGVALPLSIIATFAVMWLAGFSLDNLSLMALTIGTGFVVDDAIVMIENIVRNMEAGKCAASGRARRRWADRLHHCLAHRLADRRVHPAPVHDGARRTHVPRIRPDLVDRGRRIGDRVLDPHADDVRADPAVDP